MNYFSVEQLPELLQNLYAFVQSKLGFDEGIMLKFDYDKENAGNILGRTAQYQPNGNVIVLNVMGRHPKDILRSFAHELVHHAQKCRGDLDNAPPTAEGYAQNDKHLRNMEKEAYEVGNMLFRDWEDGIKTQQGEKQMSEKREKLEEAIRNVVVDVLTKKAQKAQKKEEKVEETPDTKNVFQKLYENAINEKYGKMGKAMSERYEKLQKEGMKRLLGK